MNKAHRVIAVLGAAMTLTTVAAAAGLPAQAATPGWHLVFSTHYGAAVDFSGYTTVIAPGQRDAWAFGANDLSGGNAASPQRPVAAQWTGSGWRDSALPAGPASQVMAASAVTTSNIWAVTQFGGYVLHWNGTAWSVAKQLPGSGAGFGQLTGVTALSSTDVWVFGSSGFTSGLGTFHYDGSTWTQQTGTGGTIAFASALAANNIYAVGSDGVSPQDALVQYNGTSWQLVTASALTGLQFNGILALSATDVWATASSPTSAGSFLVHYNGTAWSQVTLPWTVSTAGMAPDGQGGIWLTLQDSSAEQWAAHLTAAGTWSRTLIASSGTFFHALTLIPGTTSLWGAGSVDTPTGSNATVWADGAPPGAGPPAVAVAALGTNGVPYAQAPQLAPGWVSLGGKVTAVPAVAALPNANGAAPAKPLFIAPGTNHLLYIRGTTGSWVRIGPNNVSCLSAAAAITSNVLQVACETTSHGLSYDTATVPSSGLPKFTSKWRSLGGTGTITAGPAVARVNGALTFFVLATDGKIHTRTTTRGFSTTGWSCMGQPAAATQATTDETYFACEGTNHGLYEATSTGSVWSALTQLSGTVAAGPGVAATSGPVTLLLEGTNHLVYEGTADTPYTRLGTLTVNGVEAAALN